MLYRPVLHHQVSPRVLLCPLVRTGVRILTGRVARLDPISPPNLATAAARVARLGREIGSNLATLHSI